MGLTTKQTELLLLMALALETILRREDKSDYIAYKLEEKQKEVAEEMRNTD